MSNDASITAGVIILGFLFLFFTNLAADAVLLTAAAVLMLVGVLTPAEFLGGFSNIGLATVAVLFIVARGLVRTGALASVFEWLLGTPSNRAIAQGRLMLPVALVSSVLNNTPVVAMMIPMVSEWARRLKIPASQLMMPLSYAAIVGGVCTVIGTSTNLVINDRLVVSQGAGFGLFELAWIGVPLVLVCILFVMLFGRWLLPQRDETKGLFADARQFCLEMVVTASGGLEGKSIETAGLRRLPGLFLIEIIRGDRVLSAVSPLEILRAEDHLIFAGDIDSVVDLQKISGIEHVEEPLFQLDTERQQRQFVEVILGSRFPFLGRKVRDVQFRSHYGAAIVAISREGEHLKQRIGDVRLARGDILLLESPPELSQSRRLETDFLFVAPPRNSQPTLHSRRYWALMIVLLQLGLVLAGVLSLFEAGCAAVLLLIVTGCLTLADARNSIDWRILLVIGGSIALGTACQKTGVAEQFATEAVKWFAGSAQGALLGLFLVTALLTALISNVAAALILYPLAESTALQLGVSPLPFVVTLMVAASVSLATPIGYQTNLMVCGPGQYRYRDFMLMGGPLTLVLAVVTVILVPVIWPFR